jgi:hypothetical protein
MNPRILAFAESLRIDSFNDRLVQTAVGLPGAKKGDTARDMRSRVASPVTIIRACLMLAWLVSGVRI